MIPKAPLIVWEKWVDPFGIDGDDELVNDSFFDDTDNDPGDMPETGEATEQQFIKKTKHIRALSTPMGIIPMEETVPSGKIFNFWIGYTNFNITKNIAYIIEQTDGVETLDIFTRYRFRIGVGKLFEDGDVMRQINSKVYEYLA